MKKKNSYIIIIIVTVLIILTLPLLFFIFEFARTMLYWSGYAPQITEYCGTEYYSSESYREFKGGEKASDYLPKYSDIDDAEYINFYYIDNSNCETFFKNCACGVFVGIKYDQTYEAEKQKLIAKGTDFGECNWGVNTVLIEKQNVDSKEVVYYFVAYSDVNKSIMHIVYFDDEDFDWVMNTDYALNYSYTDFWNEFFCDAT